MLKTTHLTTVWFLCQAAWLAFRSTSPHKSWHLQFSRLDRHLSVAHAHLITISTRCPVPYSNSSSHLQSLSAPHPALCLRSSKKCAFLLVCLIVFEARSQYSVAPAGLKGFKLCVCLLSAWIKDQCLVYVFLIAYPIGRS